LAEHIDEKLVGVRPQPLQFAACVEHGWRLRLHMG
jgi:hypothetical protein